MASAEKSQIQKAIIKMSGNKVLQKPLVKTVASEKHLAYEIAFYRLPNIQNQESHQSINENKISTKAPSGVGDLLAIWKRVLQTPLFSGYFFPFSLCRIQNNRLCWKLSASRRPQNHESNRLQSRQVLMFWKSPGTTTFRKKSRENSAQKENATDYVRSSALFSPESPKSAFPGPSEVGPPLFPNFGIFSDFELPNVTSIWPFHALWELLCGSFATGNGLWEFQVRRRVWVNCR